MELGAQLLVFQFQFPAVPVLLIGLAVEFLKLVFVVALQAAGARILAPDPWSGQALQIGTAIAVGADKVGVQIGEGGHGFNRRGIGAAAS